MKVCTFFGSRRVPHCVREELKRAIQTMIDEYAIADFLVGHQGEFDHMVLNLLRELKQIYPHIRYTVVLAYYLPRQAETGYMPEEMLFPEEVARVSKRVVIVHRNRWMLSKASTVITCVTDTTGNAARWKETANREEKTVVEIWK